MSTENLIKKSQGLFKSRQFDEAELILKEVLRQEPENHEAQLGYALVLLMLSRVDESWGYLKQAQSTKPDNPKVYRAIAMLMRMTGALEQAITYLQLQITTSPMLIDPQVHVTLAELYAAKGDKEAIQTLLEYLVHLPINLPRKQFWLYVEISDDVGLEGLSKRSEIKGFKNLCEGQIATIRKDHDLAEQYYQWAIEKNAKLWEANLGLAANINTPVSKAGQYLLQAKKIAPQTAEVHISLAEWLVQSNQLEEASDIANRLINSAAVFESTRNRAKNILNQI